MCTNCYQLEIGNSFGKSGNAFLRNIVNIFMPQIPRCSSISLCKKRTHSEFILISPNVRKYGPEKHGIRTLFTQRLIIILTLEHVYDRLIVLKH